jgi:hypothetical protein
VHYILWCINKPPGASSDIRFAPNIEVSFHVGPETGFESAKPTYAAGSPGSTSQLPVIGS